jgi:hypothetical protein
MPCGGIYPARDVAEHRCWHCGKIGCDHFVMEWDCAIHGECIEAFLETEEGDVVLSHKHEVIRKTGDTIEVLHEGT